MMLATIPVFAFSTLSLTQVTALSQAGGADSAAIAGLRPDSGPCWAARVWLWQRCTQHHVWLPEALVDNPQSAGRPGQVPSLACLPHNCPVDTGHPIGSAFLFAPMSFMLGA